MPKLWRYPRVVATSLGLLWLGAALQAQDAPQPVPGLENPGLVDTEPMPAPVNENQSLMERLSSLEAEVSKLKAEAAAAAIPPVPPDSGNIPENVQPLTLPSSPFSYADDRAYVRNPIEPPVPFGWYPTGAGMGGFPPVPKIMTDPKSLHDAIDQNITVRLRGGGILRPYGFGRADYDIATHVFNDIQNPQYVLPGNQGVKLPNATTAVNPNHTNSSLYPRLSRFGLEYYGLPIDSLCGAVAHARAEVDFLTSNPSGPESRQLMRLRLAYGQIHYEDWTFLAGQDWDIISPLNPSINDNTLQWNNGNMGDRRPQAKALWDHDYGDGYRLQVQNGIGLGDAINSIDRDGDGVRDNEYSGTPIYEGRIGFFAPSWVENKKVLGGGWGLLGVNKTSYPVGGHTKYDMGAFGFDLQVPLTTHVMFRGEFFHGHNLDDFRGGIAQGVNVGTGQTITSTGGWGEIVTQPVSWYQNSVGYSVDDPDNADIPLGGRTQNYSLYVGNRFLLGRGIVVGADLQRWLTHWNGFDTGNAYLFKTFVQVNF